MSMRTITSMLSGLLFGLGLIISGMINPAKVLAFLDIGGAWDPSLAFVMLGGIAIAFVGFTLAGKRQQSLLGEPVHLPSNTQIDRRLLIGSAIFGTGWGLAGFCPGPALVAVALGSHDAWIFAAAMLLGMEAFNWLPTSAASAQHRMSTT